MGDDNWCIDLDDLCLPDDHADMVKAIEAAEEGYNGRPNSITNRGRSLSNDTSGGSSNKNDSEGKKERSNSKSREGRSSGPEKESTRKSISYGLPFNLSNLSFGSTKKDKTAPEFSGNKDNNDTATVYSEDSSEANRNSRIINANVFMISGCQDSQTSADVSNVSSFSLPNPNGRAGGACTSALLKGASKIWNLVPKLISFPLFAHY